MKALLLVGLFVFINEAFAASAGQAFPSSDEVKIVTELPPNCDRIGPVQVLDDETESQSNVEDKLRQKAVYLHANFVLFVPPKKRARKPELRFAEVYSCGLSKDERRTQKLITSPDLPQEKANIRERWYWSIEAGGDFPSYPGNSRTSIQSIKSMPGSKGGAVNVGVAAYLPVSPMRKTLIGVALDAYFDGVSADPVGNYVQTTALIGASALHFYGPEIGQGFYWRADLGLGVAELAQGSGSAIYDDYGLGASVAGGYGIAVARRARLLGFFKLNRVLAAGASYQNVSAGISGLF